MTRYGLTDQSARSSAGEAPAEVEGGGTSSGKGSRHLSAAARRAAKKQVLRWPPPPSCTPHPCQQKYLVFIAVFIAVFSESVLEMFCNMCTRNLGPSRGYGGTCMSLSTEKYSLERLYCKFLVSSCITLRRVLGTMLQPQERMQGSVPQADQRLAYM